MNRVRIMILVTLGVACVSLVVAAQQAAVQVVPPTDAKPNFGSVVSRPDGAMPKVPAGFTADIFVDNVPGARWMEYAPNGDLFVSQPSQNAVMVLRDTNKDGLPDECFTFAQGAPPARGGVPASACAVHAFA